MIWMLASLWFIVVIESVVIAWLLDRVQDVAARFEQWVGEDIPDGSLWPPRGRRR